MLRQRRILIYSALLFIAGLALGLFMDARGVGVAPDSAAYIASARSLVDGQGLSIPDGINPPTPMTHFGPLYPILLGILGWLGLDLLMVAKWLSAILLGLLLVLATLLVYCKTREKGWLAVALAPLLILASEDLLELHRYAFSEPLFLVFTLVGLFSLSRYLKTDANGWMFASAGAFGLAALARYVGLAAIPVILLGIYLFGNGMPMLRLRRGVVLSAISAAPLSIWLIRNWLRTGNPTDRGLAYRPITLEQLRRGVATISNWFLPGRITGTAREVLTLILLAGAVLLILTSIVRARRSRTIRGADTSDAILPAITGLYIFSYIVLLLISISFVDAQLSLSARPLAPLYLLGVTALLSILPLRLARSTWLLPGALVFGALGVLALNGVHAWEYVNRSHAGSMMMYAGKGWTEAPIIEQVDLLSPGTPIFSNGEDAIYFDTGRPAARLPEIRDPFTLEQNSAYSAEMAQMQEILEEGKGVIVYFTGITWRGYLPSREELEAQLPLKALWADEQGVIYGFR